jgi:phage gpG-like protein
MLSVELDQTNALMRLDAMPDQVRAALLTKIDALQLQLTDYVKDNKLSGQVLQMRTGALRDSIVSQIVDDGDVISVQVSSSGDVKYAAIQEFGGKTGAHDILPDKAKALAFLVGGVQVFAKVVHHPGSTIPERSYLRSTLADMKDEILDGLTDAVQQGLNAQ